MMRAGHSRLLSNQDHAPGAFKAPGALLVLQLKPPTGADNLDVEVSYKLHELILKMLPVIGGESLLHDVQVVGHPTGQDLWALSEGRVPGFCRPDTKPLHPWDKFSDYKLEVFLLPPLDNIPCHEQLDSHSDPFTILCSHQRGNPGPSPLPGMTSGQVAGWSTTTCVSSERAVLVILKTGSGSTWVRPISERKRVTGESFSSIFPTL